MTDTQNAIELTEVCFRWQRKLPPVLSIPEFTVPRGRRVFLYGPSGSGKTTLLNLLTGINVPQAGAVQILDTPLHDLSGRKRDRFRARHIGIIFQQFNLIPYLSVTDNVRLARQLAGHRHTSQEQFAEIFSALGLEEDLWHRSSHALSVGQQQRVAVARALINRPELLIADEPTSALDSDHRDDFLQLLMQAATERGSTIVFVSHDKALQHHFDDQLDIRDLQGEVAACI